MACSVLLVPLLSCKFGFHLRHPRHQAHHPVYHNQHQLIHYATPFLDYNSPTSLVLHYQLTHFSLTYSVMIYYSFPYITIKVHYRLKLPEINNTIWPVNVLDVKCTHINDSPSFGHIYCAYSTYILSYLLYQ